MPARDFLLLLLICFAWAGNFLTSKLALGEFPPLLYTALRLVLLTALLAPFVRRPAPGQWPRLVAVAICNGVLHFGLSFWSLRLSPNIAAPAILMQSYVPMASLLAWWVLGERFGWRTGAAIALSFAGVLVLGLDHTVLQSPATVVLMLVSAFFLALGTVLMRGLKGMNLFSQQGWTAIIGVTPLLAWSLAVEPDPVATIRAATWVGWFGVVYAALVASLVGHGLYYVLMQRHPVARVTPYLLLAPLLATVLGVVVLHDEVGPKLWLGGAMVLGGVLAIALRNYTRSRTPPPATEM